MLIDRSATHTHNSERRNPMLRAARAFLAVVVVWTAAHLATAKTDDARTSDWPQWLGRDRAGVWEETGILTKFPDGCSALTQAGIGNTEIMVHLRQVHLIVKGLPEVFGSLR